VRSYRGTDKITDDALDRLKWLEERFEGVMRDWETQQEQWRSMMEWLDGLRAEINRAKTIGEGVHVMVQGFAAKLDAMAAAPTLDVEALKAETAQLAEDLRATNDAIQADVVANTPAAPDPSADDPSDGV
jgi:primosomal replication protein N